MKIKIISVGERPAKWWLQAEAHYLPLIRRYAPCELLALKSARSSQKQSASTIKQLEAVSLQQHIEERGKTILLDERGAQWNTIELTNNLEQWSQNHPCISFVIGGTEGLDPAFLKAYPTHMALSKLTLPHQLARVMLLEQLFRALSYSNNHPYHR